MKLQLTEIALSLLAAPGTVARQYFRKLACDTSNVTINSMKYFVLGKLAPPMEFVKVDETQALFLILFPLVGNTLLGTALIMSPLTSIYFLGDTRFEFSQWFCLGLGLTLSLNALPTVDDAEMLLANSQSEQAKGWAHVIIFVDRARRIWADFLYAVLIGLSVPVISIWVLNNTVATRL
jgi:hypothetical protein